MAADLVIEALTRTRQRLTPPRTWAQHAWARTVTSIAVESSSPDATCWCLTGALMLELRELDPKCGSSGLAMALACEAVAQTIGLDNCGLTLEGWNDAPGRTQSDVLGVLDLTIARLTQARAGAAA
jgi:hypothetical protein